MTVESATYIDELNAANPAGTDSPAQSDDHHRLIKSVLLNSFPNISGAVSLTDAQLNKAVYFNANTTQFFFATTAPTGWTQNTTANIDGCGLQVRSGAGGASRLTGDKVGDTIDLDHTHADTIATASGGSHSHTATTSIPVEAPGTYASGPNNAASAIHTHTLTTSTHAGHTHTITGAVTTTSGLSVSLKFLDIIMCAKD